METGSEGIARWWMEEVTLADERAAVDRWLKPYCEVEGAQGPEEYTVKKKVCEEIGAWQVYHPTTIGGF
jgi:hypothetical protein